MTKFINRNTEILPFDKEDYLNFLDEDFSGKNNWKGFSMQISSNKNWTDEEKINRIKLLFEQIIREVNSNQEWIIKHDDKIMPWFVNGDEKLFPKIYSKLKESNALPNSRGSLLCDFDDLLYLSNEIVSYPYLLSYKNLDVVNVTEVLVLKATNHLTLDVLSTNENILVKLISLVDSEKFRIKKYC
jgi:hypothetical protein